MIARSIPGGSIAVAAKVSALSQSVLSVSLPWPLCFYETKAIESLRGERRNFRGAYV